MTTMAQDPKARHWEEEFYKNGYPKEVIVIEDSPTPPASSSSVATLRSSSKPPTPEHPHPQQPDQRDLRGSSGQVYNTASAAAAAFYASSKRARPYPTTDDPSSKRTKPSLIRVDQQGRSNYASNPPSEVYDDKDGHYIIKLNDSLTPRYKIMRLLGQGTFGKVVECYDRVRRTFCAIKVIRAIPKYRDASKIEIRVLNALKKRDPLNLNKCIHLLEWFDHRNHVCMVFELLGQSVFDFLKSNHFRPFPSHHIQQFAKQLLTSVAFLHDLNLIHTDLKPENILLVNHTSHPTLSGNKESFVLEDTNIRLIDFGSATFEQDYHSAVVSTRHYRAPEIILGMGWSYPCDVWSIGCILVEFFTGDALFHTHDNLEHLAMMEAVLGTLPPHLHRLASQEGQSFFKNSRLKYPDTKKSRQVVRNMKPLHELIRPTDPLKIHFLDMIQRLLWYDPTTRISAREALRHPFFAV